MVPWSYAEVYKNTTPGYIQQLRHEIVTRRTKQRWTVARICQYYRTSRRTVYKWLGRFARWGLEGLKDLSRRPKRIAGKIASWVEELIVQTRKSRTSISPPINDFLITFQDRTEPIPEVRLFLSTIPLHITPTHPIWRR